MKLLPCPFCGKLPEVFFIKKLYWIQCQNHECFIDVTSAFGSDTKETAIKNWNFRLGKDRTPKEEK